MLTTYTIASKEARVGGCRCKCMLTPRLADLFEALVVRGAATHPVKVLRNKRMIVVRQSKPIHVDSPLITRISPQSETYPAIDRTIVRLHQTQQRAYDDIGTGNGPNAGLVQRRERGGFYTAVCVKPADLDWLHGRANRDF